MKRAVDAAAARIHLAAVGPRPRTEPGDARLQHMERQPRIDEEDTPGTHGELTAPAEQRVAGPSVGGAEGHGEREPALADAARPADERDVARRQDGMEQGHAQRQRHGAQHVPVEHAQAFAPAVGGHRIERHDGLPWFVRTAKRRAPRKGSRGTPLTKCRPVNENARRSRGPRRRIYPAPIRRESGGGVNPLSSAHSSTRRRGSFSAGIPCAGAFAAWPRRSILFPRHARRVPGEVRIECAGTRSFEPAPVLSGRFTPPYGHSRREKAISRVARLRSEVPSPKMRGRLPTTDP